MTGPGPDGTDGPSAPVTTGIPERPSPLPPPRPTSPPTETIVPGRPNRPAGPRPPMARPVPPAGSTASRPVRNRKARLALRRIDPWSVFVTSLVLSLFLAVITMVAALVLYGVLSKLGIPKSINKAVTDVQGGSAVLTEGRFLGGAALIAAIDVVLLTALATLGSLLYNLTATFTGGLEVTLAERD